MHQRHAWLTGIQHRGVSVIYGDDRAFPVQGGIMFYLLNDSNLHDPHDYI